MAMQTDVLASGVRTSTGQMQDQSSRDLKRSRVKAIYIVPVAGAGSVVFRDGGSSGPIKMTINTLASASSPTYMVLPGEGLLFGTDVHATVTSIGSVMVFYG